ncbi:MAG: hypothetical protein ACRECD_13395 [Burkholderiaceae bacterium]
MKKPLIAAIGALMLGATLTALAQSGKTATPAMVDAKGCPPPPLVLPLDHGPRPQTTPYLNRLRKERHEAQLKACGMEPKKS